MTGFLKTIETVAGQTIGIIRENGQVEDCTVVAPEEVVLTPGDRNHAPLAWDAGLSQWLELPVNTALSANGMVSPSATTMVIGSDAGDVQVIGAPGKVGLFAFESGTLQALSGQIAFSWGNSGIAPTLGFYATPPIAKPNVTTGDLASLQSALSDLGLINLV
jgi:hypothetical protein